MFPFFFFGMGQVNLNGLTRLGLIQLGLTWLGRPTWFNLKTN